MPVIAGRYDAKVYRATDEVNSDWVLPLSFDFNLSGSTLDFVITRAKSTDELLRLSSADGANANGSEFEVLTTGATSTAQVIVSDADIKLLAVTKHRYGIYITNSLGQTSLYLNGIFEVSYQ